MDTFWTVPTTFVASTFLDESPDVQDRLAQLVLGPHSGMDQYIIDLRAGRWPNEPILYVKRDKHIVAWCVRSNTPRFYGNFTKNKPEIQLFVDENYRRRGIGSSMMAKAKELWGDYCVCPWDFASIEFFKKVKDGK